MPFVKKLRLVKNTVRNCAAARNWRQNTLRNCRFASNWPLLLRSQSLWKTPCTTFLLLEIGPKSHFKTVVLLEMGNISLNGKTCPKHRAQPCCCSKLARCGTAQLSFCLKLARIVRKPKPVKNAVHNFPVAWNWPHITLRNCRFSCKARLEENTVCSFPVARNWRQNTLRNCRFASN